MARHVLDLGMKLLSLVLLASLAGATGKETRLLFDFGTADASQWTTVHDTVMGGRSNGEVSRSDDGTLRFRGNVSLENNGGFASFRSRSLDLALEGTEGVELRIKGDGRTYIFSTERSDVGLFGGGYWQRFDTQKDSWMTLRLPWDAFVPTSFGEVVKSAPQFDPAMLTSMGVYVYDKKSGPFDLQIDSISAYYPGSEMAPSETVTEEFTTVFALVKAAGLEKALADKERYTLFAPSDAAFAALDPAVVEALLLPENVDALRGILLRHVVDGGVTAYAALQLAQSVPAGSAVEVKALDGSELDLRLGSKGGLSIGGSSITRTDILVGNAVIHVIDQVLVPANLKLAATDPIASFLEGVVAQGVKDFNGGEVEACATGYRTALEALRSFGELDDSRLEAVVAEALEKAATESARSAAWTLRAAIDKVRTSR